MCLFQEMPEDRKLIKRILTDHFKYHSNRNVSEITNQNLDIYKSHLLLLPPPPHPASLGAHWKHLYLFL